MIEQNILLNDIFDKPIAFDEKVRKYNQGKSFHGNMRLSKGLWRTDEEKEAYRQETLARELP